jgi:hypothetical protein
MDQTATLEAQDEAKAQAGPVGQEIHLPIRQDSARKAMGRRTRKAILLWAVGLFLVFVVLCSLAAGSGRFDSFRLGFFVLSIVLPISLAILVRNRA